MKKLLTEIKNCTVCQSFFDHPCKPVMTAHTDAKICIIGQAPGRKVQESGIPWDDKSGDNLRSWMGISDEIFYTDKLVSLLPMGFCYPGSGNSGDLPPRKECAPLWHDNVLSMMPNIQLTLLVGSYAQGYYLDNAGKNLTETVRNFHIYLPRYLPLPHPSPRNNIWKKKNPWFEQETIPALQKIVQELLKV